MRKMSKKMISFIMALTLILTSVVEIGKHTIQAAEFVTDNITRIYESENLKIYYIIKSEWNNHQTIELVLENVGAESITNWVLSIGKTGNISGLWNAKMETESDEEYVIKCQNYNNTIFPNETINIGYTLEGESLSVPEIIQLYKPKEEVADGYCVKYQESSDWGTGFQGKITIINESGKILEGWELRLDGNFDIESIWDCEMKTLEDGSYLLSHTAWNNTISVNEEYTIGFVGTKTDEEMVINNYALYTVGEGTQESCENESETSSSEIEPNTTDVDLEKTESENDTREEESETQPSVEETQPSKEETQPSKEETQPSKEETQPSEAETQPSEAETQSSEEETKLSEKETESQPSEIETNPSETESYPSGDMDWSNKTDSDEDGLTDMYEIYKLFTNPEMADTDGDGLNDGYEVDVLYTDPLMADTDENGISDAKEDFDEDGLDNITESQLNTDPYYEDSDSDELKDVDEINIHNTNPALYDTDGDGVNDGDEIILGLDPNNVATNGTSDSAITTEQVIEADNINLALVNELLDNPYNLSLKMNSAGVAENNIIATESGYAGAIVSDMVVGTAIELSYPEELVMKNVQLRFQMDEVISENTLGKYVNASDEFVGIKRFNVFKYNEELNMLLPIETHHDEGNNVVYSTVTEMGTYCIVDMELWFEQLGVELEVENGNQEEMIALMSEVTDETPSNIAITIVLEACGDNEASYNKQKEAIKCFAKEIYEDFPNTSIILIYTLPGNKYEVAPKYYYYNYQEFVEALDAIEYVYTRQNFAMEKAMYIANMIGHPYIQYNILLVARSMDYSVNQKTGGTVRYEYYIDIEDQGMHEYIKGEPEIWLLCSENNKPMEAEKTENIKSGEEAGKIAADYIFQNCKMDDGPFILANSMQLVSEDLNLVYYSNKNLSDYDEDGIRDIDEVDLDNEMVKIVTQKFIVYPTLYDYISMSEEASDGMERYYQIARSLLARRFSEIRVVPITSNPLLPDSDNDGFLDSTQYFEKLDESEWDNYFYIDDPHPLEKEIVLEWPVVDNNGGKINTMSAGFTEIRGNDLHRAIDIAAIEGTPVIAALDGIIKVVEYGHSELGNDIYLMSYINGEEYLIRYAHLSSINVKVNQVVKAGEVIGGVGSTGKSGGNHLDFAIMIDRNKFVDTLMLDMVYDRSQRTYLECQLYKNVYVDVPKVIKNCCFNGNSCLECIDYYKEVEIRYGISVKQ